MIKPFDDRLTLQQLEGVDWGEPTYESSLVIDCHRLRRVPLRELTDGNLGRLITQQMSLPYLLPMALEHLRVNPLAEGFCGLLLEAVMFVEPEFWKQHPEWHREVEAVIAEARRLAPELDEIDQKTVQEIIDNPRSRFRNI